MKIGLICAFEDEGQHIKREMRIEKTTDKLKTQFYEGTFMDQEVVLVIGGMGKVSSAVCTQVLIDEFQTDLILFAGIAGGVNPDLNIGDTVIGTETLYHDVDRAGEGIDLETIYSFFRNRFKAPTDLIEKLQAGLQGEDWPMSPFLKEIRQNVPLKVVFGRVLTGDQVITSRAKVQKFRELLKGDCVEMEGAAVAQTCALNDKPFIIIRTISDLADEVAMKMVMDSMESVVDISFQVLKAVLKVLKQ